MTVKELIINLIELIELEDVSGDAKIWVRTDIGGHMEMTPEDIWIQENGDLYFEWQQG